jgi:hypothetical protein
VIELRRCRVVEEHVVAASAHSLCGNRPAAAWTSNGLDDQPTGLCVELNFVGEIRFIEQRLRDADSP